MYSFNTCAATGSSLSSHPMDRWQASPQWNYVMTATLLGDVLSSELDSASSSVVLCAKVILKPGSAVTLHG